MKRNRIYTFDDYIKEKEAQVAQTPLAKTGTGTYNRQSLPLGATSLQKQATQRAEQATGQQAQASQPTATAPTVTTPTVTAPTPVAGAGSSPLTSFDLRNYDMDAARQKVLDVLNQKFQYKAKESPIYTILQQQYERQAQEAAGKAYASAVANTGGYGSSYATLAGEEARRQVMEGWNDQQLALYQAAREEFDAERASVLDWYSTVRQLKSDAEADYAAGGMNDATYQLLIDASTNGWYTGTNGNELRAKLETYKAGNRSIDVDAIMENLEREYQAGLADQEIARTAGNLTDEASEIYNAIYSTDEGWTGTNEAALRSQLQNLGYSQEGIDAAITAAKADALAGIEDAVKQLELSPTVSGAAEIMDAAKISGNEAEVQARVSTGVSKSLTAAMDDPKSGYEVLGVDQANWEALTDEEKADNILAAAVEAHKAGTLTDEDYYGIIKKDLFKGLDGIKKSGRMHISRFKDALDAVNGILSLEEDGYFSSDMTNRLLKEVLNRGDMKKSMEYWTSIDVPVVGTEARLYASIDKTEQEAYERLLQIMNG